MSFLAGDGLCDKTIVFPNQTIGKLADMDEGKRRTAEHWQIAARIDARMKQLDALKLQEAEILPAMAEHMEDFHRLLTSSTSTAVDTLCDEFAGFYRFAKIIESIAAGLASGKIEVPGGNTVFEENRVASAINQHVLQLEAKGITGSALIAHMVGHILDLQRLWSTTTDETLARLCQRYPGLRRYGLLMEEAAEAQRKRASNGYSHLPQLPESVKPTVVQLLSLGASLERGLQAVIDAHGQRDTSIEDALLDTNHQQWTAKLAGLSGVLRSAGVPEASRALMMTIFESMAQRINHLRGQVVAQQS
jgi:hypothetical protein